MLIAWLWPSCTLQVWLASAAWLFLRFRFYVNCCAGDTQECAQAARAQAEQLEASLQVRAA